MGAASGATENFVGLPLFFLIVLSVSAVWHIDSLSSSSSKEPLLVGPLGSLGVMEGGREIDLT